MGLGEGKVMEIFISWSGNRSGKVAEALHDWLPCVIQSVHPFMSASDIEKGSRWPQDLASHLENAQFGLICLTDENLEAPWLLFEAGALSKSIENSRVVPYLYRVSQTQLQGPLAQFQGASADKNSTLGVIKSINGALTGNGLDLEQLERTFEIWWPQLENVLEDIPEATEETPPSRSDRDILEEILRVSRQISRRSAPNFELDPEIWKSFLALGSLAGTVEPTAGVDAENPRLFDRFTRVIDRLKRAEQENELRRQIIDRLMDARHSPDNEVRSGNETDEEAQV